MLGLRPIVEIMTINFILVAIDQIVNHAAKIHYMFGGRARVPLVIRTPSGGVRQLDVTIEIRIRSLHVALKGAQLYLPFGQSNDVISIANGVLELSPSKGTHADD